MNKVVMIFAAYLAAMPAGAQIATPSPQKSAQIGSNTSQVGAEITVTNSAGKTYSADQLGAELQRLRSAVEQALPVVAAFNESFSNSDTNGNSSIAGAVSGILSGALNRGRTSGEGASGPSAQTSPRMSNLVAVLQGVLTTNAPGSVSINPETLRNLKALQNELQSINAILPLIGLNDSTNSNPTAGQSRYPNGGLTPTGR